MDLKVERTMTGRRLRLRLNLILSSSLIILLGLCWGQNAAAETHKHKNEQAHSIDPINSEMSQNLPSLKTHVRESDSSTNSKSHAELPSTGSVDSAGKTRQVRKTHHHDHSHNHHARIQRQSAFDPSIDPTNSETNLPPKTVSARDSSNNAVESDDKMPFVDFPKNSGAGGAGGPFLDFPGSSGKGKGRNAGGKGGNGEPFIDFPDRSGKKGKGRTATGVGNGEPFIDFPDRSGKKGKGRTVVGLAGNGDDAFIEFPKNGGKGKGRTVVGVQGNGDDAFIEFPKNGGKGKGRSAGGKGGNGEPFLDFPDRSGKKGKGRNAGGVGNGEPFIDFPDRSGKKGKGRNAGSKGGNGEPFIDFPDRSGKKGKGRTATGVGNGEPFIDFPDRSGKKGKGRTAGGLKGNGDDAFIEFPKNGGKGKGRNAGGKGGKGEPFIDFPKKKGKGAGKAGRGISGKGKKGKSAKGKGRNAGGAVGNETGSFIPGDPSEGPYLDFDGGANLASNGNGSGNGSEGGNGTRKMAAANTPIPECPKDPAVSPIALSNAPDPNESTKLRIKLQDRHILLQAHRNAIFGVNNNSFHEPNNSVRILNLTGETFKKWCPEKAVPPYYVDHVVSIFTELHHYMTPSRQPYITNQEVTWIQQILMWCDGNGTLGSDFVIDPVCRDDVLGTKQRLPICTDPKQKFVDDVDPLLDTILRIFELVHSACFPYFDGFGRIWHRFMMAIEDLYNQPMRQRWFKPVSNGTYFERLLGPKYKQYSENLDKCAHYYGMETVIKARIQRFPQMYGIRYGPNIKNIFNEPTPIPLP